MMEDKYTFEITDDMALEEILFEKSTALMMNAGDAMDFANSLYTSPDYFDYFESVPTKYDMFIAICYDITQRDPDAMKLARMDITPYSIFYDYCLKHNLFGKE